MKMEKKLQKPYFKNYNLLIVQDLWQTHYQTFMIIFLNVFMKLNVNIGMIIKNAKRIELCIKIVSVVLKTQTLKMI